MNPARPKRTKEEMAMGFVVDAEAFHSAATQIGGTSGTAAFSPKSYL